MLSKAEWTRIGDNRQQQTTCGREAEAEQNAGLLISLDVDISSQPQPKSNFLIHPKHVLIQVVHTLNMKVDKTDCERMADRADDQLDSAFFQRLPLEIRRMIYVEFWHLESPYLKLHIVNQSQITSRYMEWRKSSSRCLVEDQNGPDDRFEQFKASMSRVTTRADLERKRDWIRRIDSLWSLHWMCEEVHNRSLGRAEPGWSPFLPVLLTCRQM